MPKPQVTAKMGLEASGVQKTLDGVRGRFKRFASSVGRVMKTATVVGMAGVAAGLSAALRNGFDLKIMEEQTEALMKSMMGGVEEARKTMAMLAAEQRKNPMFSPEDMNRAGAALAALAGKSTANLQKLVKASEILSTMKPGATLDDAAQALRDALGGETERLKEFGFTGKELSALKEGGVTIKEFMAAMQKKGVGQHTLDALGSGVGGSLAKMKSQWDAISLQLVESFWPKIQESAKEFLGWIMDNKDQIVGMLTAITQTAMMLIKWAFNFGSALVTGIQRVAAFFGGWMVGLSSNFSIANVFKWVYQVHVIIVDAAQGALLKIIQMILEKVKEMSPKLFGWFGGNKLLSSVKKGAEANFKSVSKTVSQLKEETGINDGVREFHRTASGQTAKRGNKEEMQPQKTTEDYMKWQRQMWGKGLQTTIRVDGYNGGVPAMMGAT